MTTITRTIKIESVNCGACGITFGLESSFKTARLDDGKLFYCPNGHGISWEAINQAERTEIQLREQVEAARSLAQREAQRRAQAEAVARTADYKARAAKGQLTKTRKRIAAGVCPCCQRTFQNVARHMAGQHPEFISAQDAQTGGAS